ncbi:hypothetical protein [Desulfosporosinus sp. BICA1-9]|uniref:hypothetical protein n=1 Tax=Desulfosporosinus sp. BICA1-9 TaxID=1531958 RepID=UPI00054BAD5D|nr:hypothetical protein [Desulfosporosinus sp. BICA1-9]KJS48186.1 MAG: hypothetical protein VR66_15380 [Peptococcaceae bacterium BRH_c23]KJS87877.1 MAG: hypothetical protein JL57_13185 [Desulfosporosinus sp. BICA1-9]HBW37162.1 hypothetical protein [Desulfosporosinus sp.]
MSDWTQDEVVDTLSEIMEKARVDLEFRQLCIEDPVKAVKAISGKEIPEGKTIVFIENKGTHQTFILPNLIKDDLKEDKNPDELPWYCPEVRITMKCK